MPTIDTEDAEPGMLEVDEGRFHPSFGVDPRTGDLARGRYDDAADLDRMSVHVLLGFGYELRHGAVGTADA